MNNVFNKINYPLIGEITIPPDKSITHRALILSALLNDRIKLKNISLGKDCLNTLKIFEQLGVKYDFTNERNVIVDSSNSFNLNKEFIFDCGNSGTTTRLLAGLFSSINNLKCKMLGDDSLSTRPMKRIIEPLSKMGAVIKSNDFKLPLEITGKSLNPITYQSKIPSAQVKSSIILAGLNTNGTTKTYEKVLSRNHTEIMLKYLGADIKTGKDKDGFFVEIKKSKLIPKDIEIVGDISSAAFFMVMGAIIKGSKILIKNVGINQTRSGIIDIFKKANVNFELLNERIVSNEAVADILVKYSENIKPFTIEGDIIPRLIDEIPILSLLMLKAKGKSIVKDAKDLRNKESDRIKQIVETMHMLGVETKEYEDGFEIAGLSTISKDIKLNTHLDHRLAMTYFVLSLINEKQTTIEGMDCINTSFPEFMELFNRLNNEK